MIELKDGRMICLLFTGLQRNGKDLFIEVVPNSMQSKQLWKVAGHQLWRVVMDIDQIRTRFGLAIAAHMNEIPKTQRRKLQADEKEIDECLKDEDYVIRVINDKFNGGQRIKIIQSQHQSGSKCKLF